MTNPNLRVIVESTFLFQQGMMTFAEYLMEVLARVDDQVVDELIKGNSTETIEEYDEWEKKIGYKK